MTDGIRTNIVPVKRFIEPVLQPQNVSLQGRRLQEAKLAPRVSSLEGARIGFYHNRKPFAANALPAVEQVLREKGVRDTFVAWSTTSNKPPDETLDSLAKADAVVLAGADWGACTSWLLYAAIELEKRGTPTVSLVATNFVPSVRSTAKRRGFDDLRLIEIKEPVVDRRNVEEQIFAKGQQIESALISEDSLQRPKAVPA